MNFTKILTFAIIVMFLVTPFAGAKQEVADSVKQDKKIDEKTIDKTKESAKEITSKDKDIKVTVTDSDTRKYTVEKKSKTEISISKEEDKGEHTKSKVAFAKEDLHKIDVDGDQLYGVLHIADDGSTSHDVYSEAQLIAGTEMIFSENIVNGYSGYWEKTQTGVTSGTTIDIPDVSGSDYYITTSVNGTIPAYTAINNSRKSSFPVSSKLIGYWDFTNITSNTVSSPWGGPSATLYNGSVINGIWTQGIAGSVSNPYTTTSSDKTIGMWLYNNFSTGERRIGYAWGNLINIRYNAGTNKIVVSNGTVDVQSSAVNLEDSKWHYVLYTPSVSENRVRLRVDNALVINSSLKMTSAYDAAKQYFLQTYNNKPTSGWGSKADNIIVYNTSLSSANSTILYAGGSGISFQPEPSYNFTGYDVASGTEKIIDTDATCTGLEYVDTTGGTHTVTVRIYFTEDITKTTETKGAVYQNVSIIHTKQNATASVGSIAYELDPLYSGDPVLTSNNTNATASRNDTHVLISTGLVKQGQSFSYSVSVADDHDHGIHLNQLMKWVGTGLDFVGVAPEDWDDYIGNEIGVTVS